MARILYLECSVSRRWSLIRFCFFSSSQVRVERRRERKKRHNRTTLLSSTTTKKQKGRRNKKFSVFRFFKFISLFGISSRFCPFSLQKTQSFTTTTFPQEQILPNNADSPCCSLTYLNAEQTSNFQRAK